ncbi:CLUMA_CG020762, isoform A [Clunio marinus]|uniref:CLUMA_CG020762, isoform A n=1 Tax=Clunio marinus TaxID=568069 RepID=A0A1J1J5Y3_9DIPT|nr:CLUMA_CG020762, isoform A [Clunio marinus]
MDYTNLGFQTIDLQHQHHKCKSHKRTLFSNKEILLVFALIGALSIPRTGCDDTENFQKNSILCCLVEGPSMNDNSLKNIHLDGKLFFNS